MMKSHKLTLILAALVPFSPGASLLLAQDDSTVPSRVHQNAVDQSQVQAQLLKADDEFANLIGEFERNGLGDDPDVKMLQRVRGALKTLSQDQMNQVLQLLNQTHDSSNGQDIQANLSDAFGKQKDLASRLQQVVISFQQQADLLDLSEQFMRLANQQNDNFKATRRLADTGDPDRLNDAQKDELSVRRIEQDAIAQEVNAWLDKLPDLIKSADAPTAAQLASAMEQVPPGEMRGSLEAALSALTQGFLYKGGAAEHASYKKLREFARLLQPPLPPNEVITASAEELAKSADTSKQTESQLQNQPNRPDIAQVENLMDKQSDTSDNTEDVGKNVAQLSPKAAATLAQAKALMAQTLAQTAQKSFGQAADTQRQATALLAQARQQLLESKPTPPKPQQQMDGDPQEIKPDHGKTNGTLGDPTGSSLTGLPPRDRDKVRQTQSETFPAAYSDQIQQYLANLSGDSDRSNGDKK